MKSRILTKSFKIFKLKIKHLRNKINLKRNIFKASSKSKLLIFRRAVNYLWCYKRFRIKIAAYIRKTSFLVLKSLNKENKL